MSDTFFLRERAAAVDGRTASYVRKQQSASPITHDDLPVKLAAREIRPTIVTPPYRRGHTAEHGVLVRTLPEDLIPVLKRVVAWWTTEKREGEWVVPRDFKAFACMGTVELDLTYARMGAGVSEMELNGLMATIEVTVPADIRVESDGDEMLGHFEVKRTGNADPPPDAPILRISGTAYLGSITIKVVDPNAPGWAERLKARWASLKVKASV